MNEKQIVEVLIMRLEKLRQEKKKGDWADPHSPSYTNGYDKARDEEIEFLESILTEE